MNIYILQNKKNRNLFNLHEKGHFHLQPVLETNVKELQKKQKKQEKKKKKREKKGGRSVE